MPVRHYLMLFFMAVVMCAGLLGVTFEDRLFGNAKEPESGVTPNPRDTKTLAGVWDTSYGPMTITVNSTSENGHVEHVSGSWDQSGNTGYVTSGTFDRRTEIFLFQFSEPWHQSTGSAKFVRGEDGVFAGTWSFTGANSTSPWSMQRPGLNSQGSVVKDPLDCSAAPSMVNTSPGGSHTE
jgi:hypothetical protein